MGWGGVGDGMITFLAHAHIFDATPLVLCCYGDHGGAGRGWGERSLHMHTSLMLRHLFCIATEIMVGWGRVGDGMITFLAHAHIFDATPLVLCCYGDHGGVGQWGGVGDGMLTFLAHAHIFDATPLVLCCYGDHGGVGRGWGERSLHMPTSLMLRHLFCVATEMVGWRGVGLGMG